jgi:hypothetical protein
MTNSADQTRPPSPASAPDASPSPLPHPRKDDCEARERWRRIGLGLGEIVEFQVDALREHQPTEDGGKPQIDAFIRKISALVIASQRSMEMEDSYEKRTGGGAASAQPLSRESVRKLLELSEREIEEFIAARKRAQENKSDPDGVA